jgi:hypothetical protein
MTSLIQHLMPVLTSLAVFAFIATPAIKVAVHTAGGHWN